MTRTIRDYQPTDGQEIEVLIVSRDEAATAYGNLDGGSGASAEVATAVKPALLRRKLTTAQARLTR